ncbi:MAG TPA: riboflavin synthase subunit alpha [Micavibrio sp.]|nr:riboflavin synthase subunit alpha [Micavibrio sp.]
MFTGIIQGMGTIASVDDHDKLRTFVIEFPEGFCDGLEVGASVSIDGVCLTVTKKITPARAAFDVMLQSLSITMLGDYAVGQKVNIERAAKDGAEIGGHLLSGHVDFCAVVDKVSVIEGNKVMRFSVPPRFMRYIFSKGYIAVNGTSLTVSEASKSENWFEVWLIPETRRVTVFEEKKAGDRLNVEIERSTQVVVDTVRDTVHEALGKLQPVLEALLQEKGMSLDDFLPAPKQTGKN